MQQAARATAAVCAHLSQQRPQDEKPGSVLMRHQRDVSYSYNGKNPVRGVKRFHRHEVYAQDGGSASSSSTYE